MAFESSGRVAGLNLNEVEHTVGGLKAPLETAALAPSDSATFEPTVAK